MPAGLTKAQKETNIWFNEAEPIVHVRTQNTKMKNRLSAFAGQHPEFCKIIEDDSEIGCMEFDVQKGRITFRLTEPYSEARRKQASVAARKHPVVRQTVP